MSFSHNDVKRHQCMDEAQREVRVILAEVCLKAHIALSYPNKEKLSHQAVAIFEVLESRLHKVFEQIRACEIRSLNDLKTTFSTLLDEMYTDRLPVKEGSPPYSKLKRNKQRFLVEILHLCQQLAIYDWCLGIFSGDNVQAVEKLRQLVERAQVLNRPRVVSSYDGTIKQTLEQQRNELNDYAARIGQHLHDYQTELLHLLADTEMTLEQILARKQNKAEAALNLKKLIQQHTRDVQAYNGLAKKQRIQSIKTILRKLDRMLSLRYRRHESVAPEDALMVKRYLDQYERVLDEFVEQGRVLVQAAVQCQKDKNDYDEQLQTDIEKLKAKISEQREYAATQETILTQYHFQTLDIKNVAAQQMVREIHSQLDRVESMNLDLQECAGELQSLEINEFKKRALTIHRAGVEAIANQFSVVVDNLQKACYEQVPRGEHTDWRGNPKSEYQLWYALEQTVESLKSFDHCLMRMYQMVAEDMADSDAEMINFGLIMQALYEKVLNEMNRAASNIAQFKQHLNDNLNLVLEAFAKSSSDLSEKSYRIARKIRSQKKYLTLQFTQQLGQFENKLNQQEMVTPFALVAIPNPVITKQDVASLENKILSLRGRLDSLAQFNLSASKKPIDRRIIILLASAITGASLGAAAGSAFGFLSAGIALPITATIGAVVGFIGGLALGLFSQVISTIKNQIRLSSLQEIFSQESLLPPDAVTLSHTRRRSSVSDVFSQLAVSPSKHVSRPQPDILDECVPEKRARHSRPRCFSLNENRVIDAIELVAEFERKLAIKTLEKLSAKASTNQVYTRLMQELQAQIYPDAAKRVLQELDREDASTVEICARQLLQQQPFTELTVKAFHQDYAYLAQYVTEPPLALHSSPERKNDTPFGLSRYN